MNWKGVVSGCVCRTHAERASATPDLQGGTTACQLSPQRGQGINPVSRLGSTALAWHTTKRCLPLPHSSSRSTWAQIIPQALTLVSKLNARNLTGVRPPSMQLTWVFSCQEHIPACLQTSGTADRQFCNGPRQSSFFTRLSFGSSSQRDQVTLGCGLL
jgi:hypothetical protein